MRLIVFLAIFLTGCGPLIDGAGSPCQTLTAYDGDTVKCDGVSMRPMGPGSPHKTGFDTPEIKHRAKCPAEHELGIVARDRMRELINLPGLTIDDSGELDQYDRRLVWLRLSDGRTVGEVLLAEGLAREWPNGEKFWCD